ncbi:MAG: WecB/TagA/CpsF family glycosyltransferase [Candidatus Omnitrophica bacterium]|nr:WecB/TagA/CpsF family glycosyltransferase [Candidatus Omnitrophota bacterium]
MHRFEKNNICGVPIDIASMQETVQAVDSLIGQRKPAYVVTPNTDHIIRLQHDGILQEAYRKAALVVPDGMPLVWAAHFLGHPFKGRVAGSDLFFELCALAQAKGHKIFLLGGKGDTARIAKENLEKKYPGIQIVGAYSPSMNFGRDAEENAQILARIGEARPDILFVGVGCPKQEKWLLEKCECSGVPVSLGIGASIDFAAGALPRAPRWMRHYGLEWFWRLAMEPGRLWKRYLVEDMKFFWLVWQQKYQGRFS